MEYSSVNNISIGKAFWAQFRGYLINFRFAGLPNDVHLTFSFNENSEYVNFHVSRNVNVPEGIQKPQIVIFKMKRELLEEIAKPLYIKFFNSYLEPFDVNGLSKKIKLFVCDNLENSVIYPIIEKELISIFNEIATLQGASRLKIKGDITSITKRFSKLAKSKKIIKYLNDNQIKIPKLTSEEKVSGFIQIGEKTIFLIGIDGKWYRMKENHSLVNMLTDVLGKDLAKDLLMYTKKSIIWIKNAESKTEVLKYQKNIELMVRRNKVIN